MKKILRTLTTGKWNLAKTGTLAAILGVFSPFIAITAGVVGIFII